MIETKWMVFVIVFAVVMSFVASFMDGATGGAQSGTTLMTVAEDINNLANAIKVISWKSVVPIFFQGGGIIVDIGKACVNMFFANYNFLQPVPILQFLIIAINVGIFIMFLFTLNSAIKPFGG